MSKLKEEARKLIDKLPDTATWDDIMYEFYVKSKIDAGVRAVQRGCRPRQADRGGVVRGVPERGYSAGLGQGLGRIGRGGA